MKNVMLIATYMIIGALTFGILMTLLGREARSTELESGLSSVVEETVENMMLSNNYKIEEYNTFLADFMENLSVLLDTDSDIIINVIKADKEKGILSVEIEEKYRHLNGREGSVTCRKTVLFNRFADEPDRSCQVHFYLTKEDMEDGRDSYKSYTVTEGDLACAPAEPEQEGATFQRWLDEDDAPPDFTQPVTEEKSYYAQWD